MVQKAVDYETAKEVAVAEALAELGACAARIERLTGFGARWIRGLVRRHDGPLAQKPRDAVRWFSEDPSRLLHGWVVCAVLHEVGAPNLSRGARLVEAYRAYRRLAEPQVLLDINECALIIDLYAQGSAWLRPCTECRKPHLVLAEGSVCAVCQMMARTFCKRCGKPLEEGNRVRLYHRDCAVLAGTERVKDPRSLSVAYRVGESLGEDPVLESCR
ncbi:MAG: hypothetical protein ACRDQZ_24475 [Mycobacteriales bacterium]